MTDTQPNLSDDLLLTTPQVATRLNVTETAIRTAKSRNKDRLLEGTHWLSDAGRTLWTRAGIGVLQDLLTCNASVSATDPLPPGYLSNATVTATDPLPTRHTSVTADSLEPLSHFADAIAWEVIEHQLPGAIQSSIHRILANPSDTDRDRLLALLERIGSGVTLARMSAIFAGGLHQAIATSQTSLKALEEHHEAP